MRLYGRMKAERASAPWSTALLIAAAILSVVTFVSTRAAATVIHGTYSNDADASNDATGFPSGPFGLSSSGATPNTTYGYVDFVPFQGFTLGSITNLSADFTDVAGGAYGGSPRIELDLHNDGFITINLGTPPNFNDSDPSSFTAAYSGINLVNSPGDASYKYNYPLGTLASLFTAYGSEVVTNVYFIVDGGWGANGTQTLTLNSISVDATPVPEPASLSVFGVALIGLWGLTRLRGRKTS
jgi:hypothetical protein